MQKEDSSNLIVFFTMKAQNEEQKNKSDIKSKVNM